MVRNGVGTYCYRLALRFYDENFLCVAQCAPLIDKDYIDVYMSFLIFRWNESVRILGHGGQSILTGEYRSAIVYLFVLIRKGCGSAIEITILFISFTSNDAYRRIAVVVRLIFKYFFYSWGVLRYTRACGFKFLKFLQTVEPIPFRIECPHS